MIKNNKIKLNRRSLLKKYATIGDNLESIKIMPVTESSNERKLSHMEGLLEKYFQEENDWYLVYAILKKRALLLYSSKPESKGDIENLIEKISLENIVSLQRTKEGNVFELFEESDKIILKMRSKDSDIINKWLFNIQRNIAFSIPDYQSKFVKNRRATVTNVRLIDQKKKISSPITCFHNMNKGRRSKMEDLCLMIDSLKTGFIVKKSKKKIDSSIYAIYDGHSGIECATFLQKFLHSNLSSHPNFHNDLKKALQESFENTDEEFRKWAVFNNDISGSTAVLALVRGDEIYVANCGDSRAVLYEDEDTVVPLSFDHKPSRQDEKERIEKAGGWISTKKVLNIPKMIRLGIEEFDNVDENQENWLEVYRVNDVLAMTRSMGDILIKDLISETFKKTFTGPVVLAKPDITVTKITKKTKFMILASDGLWDVFTNEEVRDFVLSKLNSAHFTTNHNEILTQLVSEAIERGSLDNISVIMIWFDHNNK